LQVALARLGLSGYEELDILDASTPEELRGWGSPTILIDGEDVSGGRKGDSVCCRVYPESKGVPTAATIVATVKRVRSL
jgi:mercuric ion transport protein